MRYKVTDDTRLAMALDLVTEEFDPYGAAILVQEAASVLEVIGGALKAKALAAPPRRRVSRKAVKAAKRDQAQGAYA